MKSLFRPGGNVTGLATLVTDLGGKRFDCSKKPFLNLSVSRFSVTPPPRPNTLELREALRLAAAALRLNVKSREVRDANGFEPVFAALSKERPDGLYILTSALKGANRKGPPAFH